LAVLVAVLNQEIRPRSPGARAEGQPAVDALSEPAEVAKGEVAKGYVGQNLRASCRAILGDLALQQAPANVCSKMPELARRGDLHGWDARRPAMTRPLFVGAVLLLAAGSAGAADRPLPAYKAPPPVPHVYNWTGFYIGAHVGYAWDREDPSVVICNCAGAGPMPGIGRVAPIDANRVLGGFQAGFNYQFNSVVAGVEGEFAWTDIKGTSNWIEGGDPHTVSTDLRRLTTAAGRLGYAFDRALVYIKGGGAWENVDYNHTHTMLAVPGLVHSLFGSATRSGWLIGVGAEYAFWQNMSAKIEFDHIDFGSKDISTSDAAGDIVIFNIGQRLDIIKTGLNYRF
jgi:outer membrane immunogenic protein